MEVIGQVLEFIFFFEIPVFNVTFKPIYLLVASICVAIFKFWFGVKEG